MASMHGYHQLLDLSYTYNKSDLRGTVNPKDLIAAKNSILGKLQQHGSFEYFIYLLKNAKMDKHMGACKAHFTVFAVPDEYLIKQFSEDFFINIDHYDALKIIRNHTLDNIITLRDIKTEEGSSLTNLNNHHSLFTQVHPNGTITVQDAEVIDEDMAVNGNIIVINKLLLPYAQ